MKKISWALALFTAVFSLVSVSFAQTLPLVPGAADNSIGVVSNLNAQAPAEVYIRDLVLTKSTSTYQAGDTVTGSFTLLNGRAQAVSNVDYEVALVGDYQPNTLASTFYDSATFGPYYLNPNKAKKINFSYTLPKTVAGTGLGIEVTAVLSNGFSMGWADAMIQVNGEMSFLNLTKAAVSIGSDNFGAEIGPTVYPNEQAFLNIALENPTKSTITISPQIKIYNRAAPTVIEMLQASSTKVSAGGMVTLKYELPKFNNQAGVYVGNINFLNDGQEKIAAGFEFRYIIGGNIATINGLTVDRTVVSERDDINVNLAYSGSVFDVRNPAQKISAIYDVDIKLFSESNILVAEATSSLDFNQGNQKIFTFKALTGATILRAEVIVTKGGTVLADYKSTLPPIASPVPAKQINYSYLISATLLLVGLITLIIFSSIKLKNKIVVSIFLLILAGVSSPFYSVRSFTSVGSASSNTGDAPTNLQIFINTPSGNYLPGQSYYLTGSAQASNCDNQYLELDYYYHRENSSSWIHTGNSINSTGFNSDNQKITRNGQFSMGPFTAESDVGSHSISIKVYAYPYWGAAKTSEWSYLYGYQPYTVADLTVDSVTISANPVVPNNSYQYNITVTGTNNGNGGANITHEYALINYQGENVGNYRGYLIWYYDSSYTGWNGQKDKMSCAGGGIAALQINSGYGEGYLNLISCITSVSGDVRTTVFTVTFNNSFITPVLDNDISGYINNAVIGVDAGWVNFDTNFNLLSPVYPACGPATSTPSVLMPATSTQCSSASTNGSSGATGDGRWYWACIGQNTGWTDDTVWCFTKQAISASCSATSINGFSAPSPVTWTATTSGGNYSNSGDGTGGAISHYNGNTIHIFNSSGTFTPPTGTITTAKVLVVAGGGAGGTKVCGTSGTNTAGGAGGGAGGVISTTQSISAGTYPVVVGGGGAANTCASGVSSNGNNGTDSTFNTLDAKGGGGGGYNTVVGNSGGSGGGSSVATVAAGTAGQGYAGGQGTNSASIYGRGGGGGAGGAGGNGSTAINGQGGIGVSNSITGSAVTYAGGGGAGAYVGTGGAGGSGGGGQGGSAGGGNGQNGANIGGGGGGMGGGILNRLGSSGGGGSGVVIISYPANPSGWYGGPYYYSWTGTGGLPNVNSSSTASSVTQNYPAGKYYATTTVSDGVSTTTASCSVSIIQYYPLNITPIGAGAGGITSDLGGINCGSSCSFAYASGTAVTLVATPNNYSIFVSWSGGGCSGAGSCRTIMTASTTVTAKFALKSYPLTVNKVGNGLVTSNPSGINCGSGCISQTANYVLGTQITLTAAPTFNGADSFFAGWSNTTPVDICSGTGTCTVTITAGPTSVTAKFPVFDPNLNCNLAKTSPAGSSVNINTNTVWTATSVAGLNLLDSTYIKDWTVTDSNNPAPVPVTGTNPWNTIFTTTGLKTVGVRIYSADRTHLGDPCTATTVVVQSGGGASEL